MSTAIVSGGFPHLYRTDVSGAPIDASAVRSVARADVAELHAEITPAVAEEQEHHLVNIAAKRALTVTEFKQMFYARGDDKFSLANVYECANLSSNILASVWGKRVSYTRQGPGTATVHRLAPGGGGNGIAPPGHPVDNGAGPTDDAANGRKSSFVIYDAFGKGVRFVWSDLATGEHAGKQNGSLLEAARFTDNGYQPARIAVSNQGATVAATCDNLVNAINNAAGYHAGTAATGVLPGLPNLPIGAFPESHPYAQADLVGVGTWVYRAWGDQRVVYVQSRVNSGNAVQRVDITDQPGGLARALGTAEEQRATNGVTQGTHAGNPNVTAYGRQVTPYNDSRVMNYNKLGGRPDDPSGVDLAYGYATDLQRNFYAQFEVMGNLERDLCLKRECWTICSRMNIEDQLYGLSFVAETCDDTCLSVTCSRKWSEVEDALAESCLAENNTIGWGDYVDLYINVRVTNANPKTLDTIIRIRFPVQITRGPDDLGNWNVVASDAADAVITTGVGYDAPEGGNLQYRNAAQTEIHPDYMNQQQTQRWDSTRPHNTNQKVDPHDVVGNP